MTTPDDMVLVRALATCRCTLVGFDEMFGGSLNWGWFPMKLAKLWWDVRYSWLALFCRVLSMFGGFNRVADGLIR